MYCELEEGINIIFIKELLFLNIKKSVVLSKKANFSDID